MADNPCPDCCKCCADESKQDEKLHRKRCTQRYHMQADVKKPLQAVHRHQRGKLREVCSDLEGIGLSPH